MKRILIKINLVFTLLIFLTVSVSASSLSSMNLEDKVQKADIILLGTVAEDSLYFQQNKTTSTPRFEDSVPKGKLYKINIEKIISSNLEQKSIPKDFNIFIKIDKEQYSSLSFPSLIKGNRYLFFLNRDTTLDTNLLIEFNLPESKHCLYLKPALGNQQSITNTRKAEFKDYQEAVQKIANALKEKDIVKRQSILNKYSHDSNSFLSEAAERLKEKIDKEK